MTWPNQALQQTGHAKDGYSCLYAAPRLSRLLSFVFGVRIRTGERGSDAIGP